RQRPSPQTTRASSSRRRHPQSSDEGGSLAACGCVARSAAAGARRRRPAAASGDGLVALAGRVERLVDQAVGELVVLPAYVRIRDLAELPGETRRLEEELPQGGVLHLVLAGR